MPKCIFNSINNVMFFDFIALLLKLKLMHPSFKIRATELTELTAIKSTKYYIK